MEWTISANCQIVTLVSTRFETEPGYDYLTIAGHRYNGSASIKITVPTPTIVQFHSDGSATRSGFVLQWTCSKSNSQYNSLVKFNFALNFEKNSPNFMPKLYFAKKCYVQTYK